MIRTILCAGLVLSMSAFPSLAEKGWIATLGANFVVPQEMDLESDSNPTSIELSTGGGIVGSVGYDYDPVRAEIELSYRSFDIDSITENTTTNTETQNTSGDVNVVGLFLNGYFDLNVVDWVKPYVGAGVGFAYVDVDAKIDGRTGVVDDDDIVPGGQLMIGLAIPIADNFEIAAGYKLMLLGDASAAISGGSKAGDKTVTHILIHNAEVALRFRF